MEESDRILRTEEEVEKILDEQKKTFYRIIREDERMKVRQAEKIFYGMLIESASGYILTYLWYVALIAFGAWFAFRWLKQEEEE